ncbi:hypothetical protein Tco_0863357 [Tanacetum coccineum]
MCRRQGYMIQDMERKCVTTVKLWETHNKIDAILHEVVPQIVENVTNDLIEANLKPCIVNTIIDDLYAFRSQVPDFVSKEFKAHAPAIIKELFKNHVQSNMKRNLQDLADNIALWEALRRNLKSLLHLTLLKSARGSLSKHSRKDSTTYVSKQQRQQQEWDSWEEENGIDENEVIPEDVTPELIAESQNVDKRVPTIFDHARMEATLRDSLSNLSRNAEEYAYHLEQSTNFMENHIIWESRQPDILRTIPKTLIFYRPQRNPNEPPRPLYNKDLFFLKYGNTEKKKYIFSLHKIQAEEFPEPDLEEKLNRWVRKEFKTFNEDARLSIQHWKDSWHKRVYKQNQKKVRKNPEDYYSNHRITEVVRIVTDQPHRLDFMEQILVMRDNDKPYSFSKVDFKYLNKNDIKDLYYLCQSKEIDNRKVKLMNSLITFIRSCLEEIVKFCDATLEKVLNEVKLKMFESKFLKKPPLLGKLYQDIMKAYEREISERLRHRQQMRRWESFVNGRPILPTMKRLYYKDDSCWSVDLKSKATEDIISIGSFMEVLVLNHYNTCNNDKNLSKIQLEHEKEDELVVVVVKAAHELDYRIVVKEIEDELLEEMEFRWWFEQDINGESEDDNEKKLVMLNG